MVELMKLVLAKPLQAVVVVIGAVTLSLHLAMTEMKTAMALVQNKQEDVGLTIKKVVSMNEMIIRMDANLVIVKQNQDDILKRELEDED